MRGGSRFGAGRPGWRRKCEQSLAFDIRRLHQKRLLVPGKMFAWHWTTNYGDPAGSVSVHVGGDHLRLSYQWTPYGGESRPVSCSLRIERTPCHFGGSRPWFLCPRCGRRCAIVYFGGGSYACRSCLRLGYLSESEDLGGRLWRKQRKLEARLDDDGGRPKGMHRTTYERVCGRIEEVEAGRDALFFVQAARLLGACL